MIQRGQIQMEEGMSTFTGESDQVSEINTLFVFWL
jgi:hypothetical protein